MYCFASYIDRSKSGVGSSEKSQKVHSANWKEEIQLRKELDCLNRQEQQRVARISTDQRLTVHRFHKKLSRSVDIAKNHDKLRTNLETKKKERQNSRDDSESSCKHMRMIRCLNAFPKPPLPKFNQRRAKSCEPRVMTENDDILEKSAEENAEKTDAIPRPMTALERRNKIWEKQLSTVTQRINRARSAPAKTSFYKVPEFSISVENAVRAGKASPKRGMTYELDLEIYRLYREIELKQQRESVTEFLKSIEPLELVPWSPFDSDDNAHAVEINMLLSRGAGSTGAGGARLEGNTGQGRRTSRVREMSRTNSIDNPRRLSASNAWT